MFYKIIPTFVFYAFTPPIQKYIVVGTIIVLIIKWHPCVCGLYMRLDAPQASAEFNVIQLAGKTLTWTSAVFLFYIPSFRQKSITVVE